MSFKYNYFSAFGLAGLVLISAVGVQAKDKKEDVLVKVNGSAITKDVLDRNLSGVPVQLLQGREEEIRKTILDKLIENELVQQQAEAMNLQNDADFKSEKENVMRALKYNYVIKKKIDELVTDDALRKEYEIEREKHAKPAVKARHILVKTQKEAKGLIKKLADGADFAELAKKESTGPSASNGGDLGWFVPEDMVKPFSDAAFALEKGKFTQKPVQTQFGWHVIWAEDKADKRVPSFESMQPQLQKSLSQKVIGDYLKRLREEASIKYMN